tara:strand:+ start:955 stop:1158 length:204 start_codon:yes stop_codon:yes gene_type:complete
MKMTVVCSECGGTNISEGHIAMYDPNDDTYSNLPIAGGIDYPVEYYWCADCDTEHIDFIEENEYNGD